MQQEKSSLTWAQKVLFLLPALALVHMAYYWPQLPSPLASHFGPSGKADGWMDKTSFAIFYVVLVAFFSALFGGMKWLLAKCPDESINLPNKEYWLAPERRAWTLQKLGHQMSVFGIACSAFFFAVMQSVFLSNLRGSDQLAPLFFVYFAGFMLYTGIWTVQMLRDWKVPDA